MVDEDGDEFDRVRVVVRVRPGPSDGASAVLADGRRVRVLERASRARGGGREESFVAFRGPCADAGTTQRTFFDVSGVRALLDKALSGHASAVFAYGQTGSGKTYTMLGRRGGGGAGGGQDEGDCDGRENDDEAHEGVIARSIRYIFDALEREVDDRSSTESATRATVRLTCYEIFEERIIDLLTSEESSRALRVRWRKRDGFYVPNLTTRVCETASEALAIVLDGTARRRVRAHNLNASSSRSHAVLTVHVERHFEESNAPHNVRCIRGKMTFVDLAGSERLKQSGSGSEDVATRETSLINKSLFALGKVIATLADERRDARVTSTHIPYRDSKLTKLLMDSLGGRSPTVMIACCSASEAHVEETIRTLQYATRVTSILNVPEPFDSTAASKSATETGSELEDLRRANGALRRRVAELAAKFRVDDSLRADELARADDSSATTYHTSEVVHRVARVETLLRKYSEENRRLELENRALRARREVANIERADALAEVIRLRERLHNLERAFFDD